jgi:hypothetical protein
MISKMEASPMGGRNGGMVDGETVGRGGTLTVPLRRARMNVWTESP